MRKVQCESCEAQLTLTSEILAVAATEVAVFVCGQCNARQECSYVKGRATGARLWHATVQNIPPMMETPFFVEGAGQ